MFYMRGYLTRYNHYYRLTIITQIKREDIIDNQKLVNFGGCCVENNGITSNYGRLKTWLTQHNF